MMIKVEKFDFVTGKVVVTEREVPEPPYTPLMDLLRKKKQTADKKS